jgi:hypothetical protein
LLALVLEKLSKGDVVALNEDEDVIETTEDVAAMNLQVAFRKIFVIVSP